MAAVRGGETCQHSSNLCMVDGVTYTYACGPEVDEAIAQACGVPYDSARAVCTRSRNGTGKGGRGNDTASLYRILGGTLSCRGGRAYLDVSGRPAHSIEVCKLLGQYFWVHELEARGLCVPVCFRQHVSGSLSDIRLCGRVVEMLQDGGQRYGFIGHVLFPNDLYFACGPRGRGTVSGDLVAFRVSRDGDRQWASSVWKVPEHAAAAGRRL